MSRQLSEDWGEEGLSAAERLYAWNTLEVLAMSSGNIASPPMPFPARRMRCCSLRFVVGTRIDQVVDAVRAHLHDNGFPMVEVQRGAELCRVTHRFRQPLGQLGGGIDPADHRQGAGDPAEFRRIAAQRRVLRRAGPADDLGAAFLSRLLAARARRAHSAVGDRRSAGHHGRPVLGSGRDARPKMARGDEFRIDFAARCTTVCDERGIELPHAEGDVPHQGERQDRCDRTVGQATPSSQPQHGRVDGISIAAPRCQSRARGRGRTAC